MGWDRDGDGEVVWQCSYHLEELDRGPRGAMDDGMSVVGRFRRVCGMRVTETGNEWSGMGSREGGREGESIHLSHLWDKEREGNYGREQGWN